MPTSPRPKSCRPSTSLEGVLPAFGVAAGVFALVLAVLRPAGRLAGGRAGDRRRVGGRELLPPPSSRGCPGGKRIEWLPAAPLAGDRRRAAHAVPAVARRRRLGGVGGGRSPSPSVRLIPTST